jgi:MoaA/NifB/PqqE/SkfB family radical SAM enzyme
MHVHVCIDEQSLSRGGDETLHRGWCVSESPYSALVADNGAGLLSLVSQGRPRADVGAAFPSIPGASKSGFNFWIPSAGQSRTGWLWLRLESGTWHRLPVDWSLRHPQSLALNEASLQASPPAALLEAASGARELEDHVRRWLKRHPSLRLRIDLINRCNLRCIMCHYNNPDYASSPLRKMTLEEFKRFFEPLAPFIGEALLSCADEPLLSPIFPEVLRYLATEHPHVYVHFCTNSMLMDARIRRVIVETGVGKVMSSIDGVRRATFERIRKGARFEQVVRNIEALHQLRDQCGAKRPDIQCNFVMMRSNIAEAPLAVELAKRLGACALDFHHAVPTYGIDMGQERLEFHPGLYNAWREKILEAGRRFNLRLFLPEAYAGAEPVAVSPEPGLDLSEFEAALKDLPLDDTQGLVPRQAPEASIANVQEEFGEVFCEMPFFELFANNDKLMPCPFQKQVEAPLNAQTNPLDVFFSKPFAELRKAMLSPKGHPGCSECPLANKKLSVKEA